MKDEGGSKTESSLDESIAATIINYPLNLFVAIIEMLGSYFKMLFDIITG